MRILLVAPEFPPVSIGGGGVVYLTLSKQLKLMGHQVDVVAGNFHNKGLIGKVETQTANNVDVAFIPLLAFPKSSNTEFSSYTLPTFRGLLHILKTIIQSKADVIHLHGFCHPMIDLSAFTCIMLRKKYVLTSHGIPRTPQTQGVVPRFLFRIYLSTIERVIVRGASALTTVSTVLKMECLTKNLVNRNTIVIPNGPNTALNPVSPQNISKIEQKYALANKNVIFSIGRLNFSKGFQFLVDAMKTVSDKLPSAVAVVAGSGPYEASLTELINQKGLSSKVKLVGWVNEESKAALYQRSELVVFPSLNEPFGIVLLEALTMHKPIVAFNSSSANEIVGDAGLLVPVGDSEKLADAILQIINDEALRKKIVANTSKSKMLGWTEIASRYVQVYDNLIKANAQTITR